MIELFSPEHSESSGNESAEQQLFAESQASPAKPRQTPTTSAVRSANLLNAARVDKLRPASHPPSSPPPPYTNVSAVADAVEDMTGGTGKLKRPSFIRAVMARNPRQNLARRGDIYEIGESPQKNGSAPYALVEAVNRNKPLKKVKKGSKADVQSDEPEAAHQPSSPPSAQPVRVADEDEPPTMETEALRLSSPPLTTRSKTDHSPKQQGKSGRLAGKTAEVSLPDKKPRSKRKATREPFAEEGPSKSPRRETPDALEPSTASLPNGEALPVRSKKLITLPKPSARTRAATKSSKSSKDGDVDGREVVDLQNNNDSEPRPAKRGRGRPSNAAKSKPTQPAPDPQYDAEAEARPTKRGRGRPSRASGDSSKQPDSTSSGPGRPRRKERQANSKPTEDQREPILVGSTRAVNGVLRETASDSELLAAANTDELQTSEADVSDSAGSAESEPEMDTGIAFKKVLAFSESEKRRGNCQSEQAAHIRRQCRAGKRLLQQPETTIKDVTASIRELRTTLSQYGADSDSTERKQLKADAYGHLFRELVACLIHIHAWLEKGYGEVTEALEAMRALFTLAHAILSFKDMISSWKLSTRSKDVGMVKSIDRNLIVPLRSVVDTYSINYNELKTQKQEEEVRRRKEEVLEEERRREAKAELQKDRWKRWQDLHVWRQQCEPDSQRRRRLVIDAKLFEARFDERDANGVKFERIPLFRDRDSPPPQAGAVSEEQWDDTQMAALIEGLTMFAGRFQNICPVSAPNLEQVQTFSARYSGPIAALGVPCGTLLSPS
jgi:hypothetical protein